MNAPTFGDPALPERFWGKVEVDSAGCWRWTGHCTDKGYGQFRLGRVTSTHRLAFEHLVGPIPEGLVLDHLCRVRSCCNPRHLEAVSNRENVLRGVGPTAENAAKTHCKYGHEFTPENTYERAPGIRDCRTCIRRRGRDQDVRRQAARRQAAA